MSSSPKLMCLIGLLSLIHCAYSAAQHRSYLRLLNQDLTHLPVDIIVQTVLSLLLVCYSAGFVAGDFRAISTDRQMRAFNVEMSLVRDQIERWKGTAGIYRLQFWQETLDALFGVKDGPLARQPLIEALRVYRHEECLHEQLSLLISARQSTLGDRPFHSVQSLQQYALHTHGVMLRLSASAITECALNAFNTEHTQLIQHLSTCLGVVTLLRATGPLLTRDIVLLPLDWLKQYQCTPQSIVSGRSVSSLQSIAQHAHSLASDHLAQARLIGAQLPRKHRLAYLPAASVDLFLARLEKVDYNLMDSRLQMPYPILPAKLLARKFRGTF